MRTWFTVLLLIASATLSVATCSYWYDGHTFRDLETRLYHQTGYSQAKAECVASSGSAFRACQIAEREDQSSESL